jgi:hypothetical protein
VKRIARLLLVAACLAPVPAAAVEKPAQLPWSIRTSDETTLTRRIAEDLEARLQAVYRPGGPPRTPVQVTIGPDALRTVLDTPAGPVLSAYTSSQVWHRAARGRKVAVSAVFAEPAPADQMRLVELLYGRAVPVAAILSDENAYLRPVLGQVTVEPFVEGADINKALNRLSRSKVLLAIPDRAVFNTDNIRNILLSAYRRNQGVIGFSADMVKAGALAATYSEIGDVNAQVAEMVAQYIATGQLPGPQFPRYFRTIVNEPIARSLGLKVDDSVRQFSRRAPVVKVAR